MNNSDISLTPRAKNLLQKAQEISKFENHSYVGAEHIFLAFLELEESQKIHYLFRCLNLDSKKVREYLFEDSNFLQKKQENQNIIPDLQ